MCLIRNFPSVVKMKSHDMNHDGLLAYLSGSNEIWERDVVCEMTLFGVLLESRSEDSVVLISRYRYRLTAIAEGKYDYHLYLLLVKQDGYRNLRDKK